MAKNHLLLPDLNNLHFQKQLHCLEFLKDVSRSGTDNLKLRKNSFYITSIIIIEIDYLPAFLIINCSTSLFTPLSPEKSVELNTSESLPVTFKSVSFEECDPTPTATIVIPSFLSSEKQ